MADSTKSKTASVENIDGVRWLHVPIRDSLDDAGITALIEQLAPATVGLVGNYADLQRGGAAVLKDQGSMSEGVERPAGVTDQDIAVTKAVEGAVAAAVESSPGTGNSAGDAHTGDTGGTTASRKA